MDTAVGFGCHLNLKLHYNFQYLIKETQEWLRISKNQLVLLLLSIQCTLAQQK